MRVGRVAQVGSPRELYRRPVDSFVASFLGRAALLEGRLEAAPADATVAVRTPLGLVLALSRPDLAPGSSVVCAIRAESVRLSRPDSTPGPNVFPVKVLTHTYQGDTVQYELLGPGPTELVSLMMGDVDPGFSPGDSAQAAFAPENVCLMPK